MSLMTSEKLAMTCSSVMTHTSVTDPITGEVSQRSMRTCEGSGTSTSSFKGFTVIYILYDLILEDYNHQNIFYLHK